MNKFFSPRSAALGLIVWVVVDLVLMLALAGLIWAENAANRGITFRPDPQPIPLTNGPKLGVNAFNLHLEPDPAVVTRTLELARDLGAGYVRMQVPWEDIEIHGRGDFRDRRHLDTVGDISAWAKYDRIVDTANNLEIELIWRLERPPLWARQQLANTSYFTEGLLLDGNSTGPPDVLDDYTNFVRTVVERYRGKLRYIQIWNEPNLKNEWNWQEPKPEDFTAMLCAAYDAAKAADPAIVVLFPSLAPTDGLDKRAPMSELEYLDRVYAAGGGRCFDVMSAQAYGLGQPPDEHRFVFLRGRGNWQWTRPIDTRNDVTRIVLLREVMERNGDANKPVWVGEFGWNSAPETIPPERRMTWGPPVSEELKGEYMVGMIERARREWPWVGVMNVWMLRYGGFADPAPADPTPYFALVSRDWQPLPAFAQLRNEAARPSAGVGAHPWDHPAVQPIDGGWQIVFTGQRITLLGGFDGAIEPILDSEPTSLIRDGIDGQQALSSEWLSDERHILEIRGGPAPSGFIVERRPPLPWLWPSASVLLLLASAAAGVGTMHATFRALSALLAWRAQMAQRWFVLREDVLLMVGMGVATLIAYKAAPQVIPTVLGLGFFGLLSLRRPDLGLLWVFATVPLFFMPKGLWDAEFGLPADGLRLPLHELLLLVVLATSGVHVLWAWVRAGFPRPQIDRDTLNPYRSVLLPVGLFVVAGTLGLVVAGDRGPALREWRWLIIEPLIAAGLLRFWIEQVEDPAVLRQQVTLTVLLSAGAVGAIGLLQFAGLNLAPFIGDKVGFSADQLAVEGVRRVNSVYGHPNNLGLFLGRIWPVAAVLAWTAWRIELPWGQRGFYISLTLLTLGGLLVSFSRGAWLGAAAAALTLGLILGPPDLWRSARFRWIAGGGLLLGAVALGIAVALGVERLNPFAGSSGIRIKTWLSALAMWRDHPFLGIGLDQFVRLYPQYIDPSLAGTNEINTAHPHTMILDLVLRMGLLGLLAFGWIWWWLFRSAFSYARHVPLAAGIAAAAVAVFVHGLVDSFYFWPDLAFIFWLWFALLINLSETPTSETPAK